MDDLLFAGCQAEMQASIVLLAPSYQARELSHRLGSYAASQDLDLADLLPRDGGEPERARDWSVPCRLALLSSGQGAVGPEILHRASPQTRVLCVEATLDQAADRWGAVCPPGTVISVGARRYSRPQRDLMRNRQRLMSLHDLDLFSAISSAAEESAESPLWVRIGLDVLQGWGQMVASGGVSVAELQDALRAIPGRRVVGFEVSGFPTEHEPNPPLALTGVELLRDNILSWWARD